MRFQHYLICTAAVAALAANPLTGQSNMTLEECIDYARRHSSAVALSAAELEQSKADYLQAVGNFLPRVSAGTGASWNFGRGLDAETNTYTDINSFNNSYSIHATMTLFDGLQSVYRLRMAHARREASRLSVREQQELAALGTTEAYYDLVYARQMQELAMQKYEESSRLHRQTARMEELGMKSRPDVLEMQSRMAGDRLALTQADNQCIIALIRLKEKMNFPIDDELVVDDMPADSLSADMAESDSSAGVFARAAHHHPVLLRAKLDEQAATDRLRAARGAFLPSVSVSGGWNTGFSRFLNGSDYTPFSEQFRNRRGEYVSLNLSIPIFSGFSLVSHLRQARAERRAASVRRGEAERRLYSEIAQAMADRDAALASYRQAKEHADAMQAAYEAVLQRYEEGLNTAIDLTTQANRLLDARVQRLRAAMTYRLKCKLIAYYGCLSD